MTREEWLSQFIDELLKLRPLVGHKLARTMGLGAYSDKAHPRVAAREWGKPREKKARAAPLAPQGQQPQTGRDA